MDRKRRQCLVTLGGLPLAVFGSARSVRGTETAPARSAAARSDPAIVLEANDRGLPPRAPLQYGDESLGPILRVRRGVATRIILRNRLAGPTGLDLHGVQVRPPLGGAGAVGGVVAPGAEAEIDIVPPDSGTFWFHPWLNERHRDETAEGLRGVLLVEEERPPDVDADDVLVLSDRDASPEAVAAPRTLKDRIGIDGASDWPRVDLRAPGARIRLRVVNASTRRALAVACSGADPYVVAIDGQPSELFKPLAGSLPVGPGARFDLMVDLPRSAGAAFRLAVRGSAPGEEPATALIVKTEGNVTAERQPIRPLPPNPLLPVAIPLETSTRATLEVQRKSGTKTGDAAIWTVNGVSGIELPKRPLFAARRGSAVTLALKNASPELVAFRLHGFSMRLLHDLDDGWEPYWRDSVLVPPGITHHVAFLGDKPGRWLIESPFFDQAAGGMRAWFEIT